MDNAVDTSPLSAPSAKRGRSDPSKPAGAELMPPPSPSFGAPRTPIRLSQETPASIGSDPSDPSEAPTGTYFVIFFCISFGIKHCL